MDLSTVSAALGAVVLEHVGAGRFVRVSAAPTWWHDCVDERSPELVVGEAFPFLSVFMPDAERVWSQPKAAPLASELWTTVDARGRDIHLEAFATRAGDAAVLVIQRNDQAFAERQLMLQRARELRLTHDALMHEIERKDILLHAIVHDLSAPLHSIMGALSLLRECDLPPVAKRWTELANKTAVRQRELIRGILDVFVGEQGPAATTEPLRIDLRSAIERAIAEREPVARQVRVELVTQIADTAPVAADEMRLIRVLVNLLDNAIRHTPPGKRVRLTTTTETRNVVLAVEDDGPGVPAALMPRLFEKLARDPRGGGTGLGLYFCRITVEQWGGGIGYEPRPSGGARFWIRLPTVAADRNLQGARHGSTAAAR